MPALLRYWNAADQCINHLVQGYSKRMQSAAGPPQPPPKPDPGDCCGGGCVNCVYDLYEIALERYESQLAQWLARQPPPATENP